MIDHGNHILILFHLYYYSRHSECCEPFSFFSCYHFDWKHNSSFLWILSMGDSKHELSTINMFYPPPPPPHQKKIIVILCPYVPITPPLYNSHFLLSPRWPLWRGLTVHKSGFKTLLTNTPGTHLGIFWAGMCRLGLQIGTTFLKKFPLRLTPRSKSFIPRSRIRPKTDTPF